MFLHLRLRIVFLPSLNSDEIMFEARKIVQYEKDWIRTKSMNFFINRIITTINQQFISQVVHEFFTFVFFYFLFPLYLFYFVLLFTVRFTTIVQFLVGQEDQN